MKTFKKILAAALALAMLLALCACGKDDKNDGKVNTSKDSTQQAPTNNSGLIPYTVKVVDGQGNPMTEGIVVKFMQNGKQVAMQIPNAKGVATKELAKGNYTVELMFTDSSQSGHYDKAAAILTADKTTLELTLINALGSNTTQLVVNGENVDAYIVNSGSTHVPVKASVRNYFLFTPTKGGTYEFRVDNSGIKLGYYGAPHFVQSQSAIDPIDNVVTISISDSALGGTYVIGLDGLDANTEAVLGIIRTGDPTITIADMPWTDYKTTHTPAPYTLNLNGKSLKYIDIKGKTENAKLIYNESDGYYHFGTANGPVVLMHLGQKAPYVSLQTVIEGDGLGGGAPIREYFFDKDGNFLKKEDYTNILRKYFENMDQDVGVYPLTKDLEYIIKNGCHGWWDKDDPDFIFTDCNPEIGWMFALCYVG